MEKFQNRYRISSARASWWDYSVNGCYFITICVVNHECLLGNVVKGTMQLSPIGKIVNEEWYKSFEIRKELFCDAFIIMPNHIHTILRIDNSVSVETHGRASLQSQPPQSQPPQSQPPQSQPPQSQPPQSHPHPSSPKPHRPPQSISSFVAGFKSAATVRINEFRNMPKTPVWQPRFHDRIIRNDGEYQRIISYIYENPSKWVDDELYISC